MSDGTVSCLRPPEDPTFNNQGSISLGERYRHLNKPHSTLKLLKHEEKNQRTRLFSQMYHQKVAVRAGRKPPVEIGAGKAAGFTTFPADAHKPRARRMSQTDIRRMNSSRPPLKSGMRVGVHSSLQACCNVYLWTASSPSSPLAVHAERRTARHSLA